MNDLNIVGGTLVRPEGCLAGGLEIKDGRIVRVLKPGEAPDPAKETVNAEGMLVFPGMIDSHVHIRGGKLSHREDFASGTMAAAAGGVTTVAEMPVANPPASTEEAFLARKAEATAAAYVDVALYGGAGADNLEDIGRLARQGAVAWVIEAARKTGCRASVCHVSTPEAVKMIQAARAEGVQVYAETCPQYILFNEDTAEHAGVFARMKPPLRDPQRMAELRRMYRDGAFAMTGSDHAPYLKEEKLKNGQDIWHTFDGLPGLELSLPLLLNAVADGTLTCEAIAEATAESTARMLGLAPRKGRLAEGADADVVLVKKYAVPVPLDISKLFTKARESAVLYEGLPMHYTIVRTYVRGEKVFQEGTITGKQGWGTFVSPAE